MTNGQFRMRDVLWVLYRNASRFFQKQGPPRLQSIAVVEVAVTGWLMVLVSYPLLFLGVDIIPNAPRWVLFVVAIALMPLFAWFVVPESGFAKYEERRRSWPNPEPDWDVPVTLLVGAGWFPIGFVLGIIDRYLH